MEISSCPQPTAAVLRYGAVHTARAPEMLGKQALAGSLGSRHFKWDQQQHSKVRDRSLGADKTSLKTEPPHLAENHASLQPQLQCHAPFARAPLGWTCWIFCLSFLPPYPQHLCFPRGMPRPCPMASRWHLHRSQTNQTASQP